MNIDTELSRLAIEHDAQLECNRNIFNEKQDLEALVNWLKATSEKDSRTI
jgi:hypothetical protein